MFTENKIGLKQLAKGMNIDVLRDCDFCHIGKVPSLLNNRVVPCISEKYIKEAAKLEGVVGIITTEALVSFVPQHMGAATAQKPKLASLWLHERLTEMDGFLWEHFPTKIHPSAKIDPLASIAKNDVVIGKNTVIGPGTIIKERTIIGEDCTIGVDVVIGLDALDIMPESSPRRVLKQGGGVKIERGVTILGKSTIIRGTFAGFTTIGEDSILDVLIYLAHDCKVGQRVTIVAGSTISGRCEIGDDVYIGPNCTISNGLKVGNRGKVSLGSVVTRDVKAGQTVTGNFAVEHSLWLKFVRSLAKS